MSLSPPPESVRVSADPSGLDIEVLSAAQHPLGLLLVAIGAALSLPLWVIGGEEDPGPAMLATSAGTIGGFLLGQWGWPNGAPVRIRIEARRMIVSRAWRPTEQLVYADLVSVELRRPEKRPIEVWIRARDPARGDPLVWFTVRNIDAADWLVEVLGTHVSEGRARDGTGRAEVPDAIRRLSGRALE
jgi:hypothetical protein